MMRDSASREFAMPFGRAASSKAKAPLANQCETVWMNSAAQPFDVYSASACRKGNFAA
jgi:hypothetical protein